MLPTSLIIVGPVTTPSDRLCGVAKDLSQGFQKITLCHLGSLGEPVTPETRFRKRTQP